MTQQFPKIVATGVHEYCEEYDVVLTQTNGLYAGRNAETSARHGYGRWVVRALNEAGYNSTEVDVLELLVWLKVNRPDLCAEAGLRECEIEASA